MDTILIPIWACLAIWLAWLWVALWQWFLASASIEILWKNPHLISTLRLYTILWIALVESAAIYWLIIAFWILSSDTINWYQAIWAWLAIWLTWFWSGYWEWKMVWKALNAVNRNPENKTNVLQFMVLSVALLETAAIYGFIVSYQIIS